MPNFTEYVRADSHAAPGRPMLTLLRRGLISFNLAAYRALGEPAAVALSYDPDEGIVALRKVRPGYRNAFRVRKQAHSRSFLVGAIGFVSYHQIGAGVSRRYSGVAYGPGTLGFTVSEGVEVTGHHSGGRECAQG